MGLCYFFQVFLIISYAPLVRQLAEIIFQGDISIQQQEASSDSPQTVSYNSLRLFQIIMCPPQEHPIFHLHHPEKWGVG